MSNRDSSPVLFDYPNPSSNVFLMMRFRDTEQHREILAAVREALEYYGLHGLRADEKSYSDSLWSNVKSYMNACDYGIAVFEQIEDNDFNPNVSLELGYMMARQKRILLLKEKHLKTLPSDVVGYLYKSFDYYHVSNSIRPSVFEWLRDIGIAKSPTERVVLFISYGGTCRCAMAKVVFDQLLKGRHLPYSLRVVSVAYRFGGTNEASHGARRVIYDAYGSDLLEYHRVTRRNPGLLADADLILVREEKLREGLPAEKTFAFNPFLGRDGDVANPWPDDEDEAAHSRYRDCMRQIRTAMDTGADRILSYLDQYPTAR
jgi:protein-tyrosine-phosphatase/nucleoside 2-deoxyribosyltransferase